MQADAVCGGRGTAGAGPQYEYDTVLQGCIHTGAGVAECMAFSSATGVVAFVGTTAELAAQTLAGRLEHSGGSGTHTVRHCAAALPAFHDAHVHPYGAGCRRFGLSRDPSHSAIDVSACTDWDGEHGMCTEIARRLNRGAAVAAAHFGLPPVVLVEGCDPAIIEGDRGVAAITDQLDRVSRDFVFPATGEGGSGPVPIVCLVGDARRPCAAIVNTPAAALLADTFGDCPGWADGARAGLRAGGVPAVRYALLSPASYASAELRALRKGLMELAANGIVGCTDAFVFASRIPVYQALMHLERRRGGCLPRVSLAIGVKPNMSDEAIESDLEAMSQSRCGWEETDYQLNIRECKLEIDDISSPWTYGEDCIPAPPPDNFRYHDGYPWSVPRLQRVLQSMVRRGFSIHFHSYGPMAVRKMVETTVHAEQSVDATEGLPVDFRHKMAHISQMQIDANFALPLNFFAVYQPLWFSDLPVGPQKKQAYSSATENDHCTLLSTAESRERVCYGSDWDVTALSPFKGIAAVLRCPDAFDPDVTAQSCLTAAVQSYTAASARSMWLEQVSGVLQPGMFADIVVLDRDIFHPPDGQPHSAWVEQAGVQETWCRGQRIWPDDTKMDAPTPMGVSKAVCVPVSSDIGEMRCSCCQFL